MTATTKTTRITDWNGLHEFIFNPSLWPAFPPRAHVVRDAYVVLEDDEATIKWNTVPLLSRDNVRFTFDADGDLIGVELIKEM